VTNGGTHDLQEDRINVICCLEQYDNSRTRQTFLYNCPKDGRSSSNVKKCSHLIDIVCTI
jgi:hypothetical protein